MNSFKRILIVRTDRLGDVVLSTPVICLLRRAFPESFLAMMVRSYTRGAVERHPDLDEVILYDKRGIHESWLSSWRFAKKLQDYCFDLALILHSTNRVNIITYLAKIPRRVGWNRKMGFLLTDRLPYQKPKGLKHEMENNIDLLRYLKVPVVSEKPFVFVPETVRVEVKHILKQAGIKEGMRYIAVHPGASCSSKLWSAERYSVLVKMVWENAGVPSVIIGGQNAVSLAHIVCKNADSRMVNLSGRLSVKQTAAVLQNALCLVSNDSGPVHLATAVKTPVLALFGRSHHRALGPKVWGPVGEKDRVLQKDAGCNICKAHNCQRGFACLYALTVEEVYTEVVDMISPHYS